MNLKYTAALIGVGLVLGLGVGVPSAKLFEGVKTVTKPVPVKISNGITTKQMIGSFGSPAQVLSTSQSLTIPAGCGLYVGKINSTTGKPYWAVIVCAFSR